MKKAILLVVASASIMAFTGCANLPGIVEQLGKDHNNVSVTVTTIYGNMKYARSGATNAAVGTDGSITPK